MIKVCVVRTPFRNKCFALDGTHEKTRENAYVTPLRNILNFHMTFFLNIYEEFVQFAKKLSK